MRHPLINIANRYSITEKEDQEEQEEQEDNTFLSSLRDGSVIRHKNDICFVCQGAEGRMIMYASSYGNWTFLRDCPDKQYNAKTVKILFRAPKFRKSPRKRNKI